MDDETERTRTDSHSGSRVTDLIEGYLADLEGRLPSDPERRRQILGELRSHLWERVYDEQARDPARSQEDVAREVLTGFGSPTDLALAYGPGGRTLLKKPSGETVFRVGRAVGRGTRTFLKGVGIALVVLLVVGLSAGAWAFHELRPVFERNAPYEVYDYSQSCDARPCAEGAIEHSFFVHNRSREVRLDIHSRGYRQELDDPPTSSGATEPAPSVIVTLWDAEGSVVYNRTFAARLGGYTSEALTLPPTSGVWTMSYRYDPGFRGTLSVDVATIGLPEGATPW